MFSEVRRKPQEPGVGSAAASPIATPSPGQECAGQAWGGDRMASDGVPVVQQGQKCARKDGELVGSNPGAATPLPLVPHNPERSPLSPVPGSDSLF